MKKMLLAMTMAVTLVLAACGDDTTTSGASPTTTPPAGVTAAVDWEARTAEVDGLVGYEITFCEGEAPFLCVTRQGEIVGALELVSYPAEGSTLAASVDAWLDDFIETIADDRRRGCDPDFTIEADDPEPAPFAGERGHRYGFRGTIDDRIVERVTGHIVEVDGTVHVLTMNALADDGCLAREGELPLDAVDGLRPALAAIAAGSTNLPPVDAPASGDAATESSGWLRTRSVEGFVDVDPAVMLSGEEAVAAAREDGQLPPDGQLPNDFYIDDDEATTRTYPVSDQLRVELYDCSDECELRAVDSQAFLRGDVEPYGGDHALVTLELEDGVVAAIRELYVP